jgi:hypothetical protein
MTRPGSLVLVLVTTPKRSVRVSKMLMLLE